MRFVRTVVNDWTFSFIGSVQTGRPYPVSTGDGSFSGSAFPALGAETNQRPNVCTAGSKIPGCAGAPVGALVTTNIGSHGGSTLALSENGVAACNNPALLIATSPALPGVPPPAFLPAASANCRALQTTYVAPAGASGSGPVDSFTGDAVDFQFIDGNLGRNLGLTKGLTDFDISLLKAFRIPKRESMRVELKLDVFNLFNHPNFTANDSFDTLNALSLPTLGPNFNCADRTTKDCRNGYLNPYTGLYLGANGAPLNISTFLSGRPDKNLASPNFAGLGDPGATVLGLSTGAGRVMQLPLRAPSYHRPKD